jgi:hypothetical protein
MYCILGNGNRYESGANVHIIINDQSKLAYKIKLKKIHIC